MNNADTITSYYLYGRATPPMGDEFLDEKWINHSNIEPITWSNAQFDDYMTNGAGRFANASQMELVNKFFSIAHFTKYEDGERHEFSLSEAIRAFTGKYLTEKKEKYLYQHQLSQSDFKGEGGLEWAERAYIFQSQAYALNQNVRFVIRADGTRVIENFAIMLQDEDFDFHSDSILTQLGNGLIINDIDPSNIGRKIDFVYPHSSEYTSNTVYALSDFIEDKDRYLEENHGTYLELYSPMMDLVDKLWNSGVTRFVDDKGRAVYYGTNESDYIIATNKDSKLKDYRIQNQSGTVQIAGNGNDTLYGNNHGVVLLSNQSDYLQGGKDFDTYYAGNKDIILDSDGEGKVEFNGIDLTGRKKKNSETGLYEDDDFRYEELGDTLTVTSKSTSESISIFEWANKKLGIELGGNDIEVSITEEASASEGNSGIQSLSFTVSLSRVLEDGEALEVSVSDTKEGSLTFESGEQSKTFTHIWTGDTQNEGEIDHIATLTPTATYSGSAEDVEVTIENSGTATVYDDDDKQRYDPLALDTDKDGFISTSSLEESTTYFDITGDGLRERVGWIQSNDALVTYDKNENGQIDGIDEVFGSLSESGFEELKRLIDSNHDNTIDRRDELFQRLQVWNDINQDAKVQTGELRTLKEAGVSSIDLNYVATNIDLNGNLLTEASKYTDSNGNKELAADMQLATDAKDTKVYIEDIPDFTVDPVTHLLPQLEGTGLVYDSFIKYNIDPEFKALALEMSTNMPRIATEFDSLFNERKVA